MSPHAEETTTTNGTMSNGDAPLTNGETPQSRVLSHLQTYPVVHDSVEFYKSNPYGAKSLAIFNDTYQRVLAPFHPYLKTPLSYVAPYLHKADELGDSSLSKVESRFPIVKEDTSKLRDMAFTPYTYLSSTYQDEYSKTHGQGIVKTGKAFISTELKVAHDAFNVLLSYWNQSKEHTAKKVDEIKQ
jgi:hypothetical protein